MSTNTNIFEKNPTKGGTPAKDRRDSDSTLVKIFVDPKFENENKVFRFVPADCKTVVKSKKDVAL